MRTYTYEERLKVCAAMAAGAALCPRCRAPVGERRLQSLQDRMLKRLGKVAYRCSNPSCACECTPISHLTAVPLPRVPPPGSRPAEDPDPA